VFLVFIGVAAGLAIGLPSVVAPLATGAFIGLMMSLFLRRARQECPIEGSQSRIHALSTVGAVAVVFAVGVASSSLGQSENASINAQQVDGNAKIQRVIIPVDDKGRQAGSKYFVSEDFLRELLQHDQASPSLAGEWLLKGVQLVGELRQAAAPANVVAGEWSLSCDVEVVSRDTVVVLPLQLREADWPTSALVDGVPVPLEWREAGNECAFTIAEPGEHTSVIAFTPHVTTDAQGQMLTLTVPPKQDAVLKLVRPATLDDLVVTGATTRVTGPRTASEYVLGGESRLSLRWPMPESTESATRRLQVTELDWLRVSDNEIELDTKYVFEGDGELPKSVSIAHSRDWELLSEQGAVEELLPSSSKEQGLVRVSLADDGVSRRQVTVRWRYANGQQLGQLRVPPVELVGQTVTQRWRAVSSAPTLACVATVAESQQATSSEFLAVWDEPGVEEAPQIAIKTSERGDTWKIDVSPLSVASVVNQELHVAVGSDAMRMVYEAAVRPGTRHRYQLPLRVPPNLIVAEIAVQRAERRIPRRWVRAAGDRVNVYFGEELADQFRLTLRGTLPRSDKGGTNGLPLVLADSSLATDIAVHLYRDEDVLLDAEGLPDAESVGQVLGTIPAGWSARQLGVYRVDRQAAKNVRLRVGRNEIELAGDTLISLTNDGENWVAGFHGDLVVKRGILDTLRLRSPQTWQGPFTIETSAAAAVEAPVDGDPYILVHFSESLPTGSRLQLSLQAPLEPVAGPVAVPQIGSSPRIRGKRFVSVPSSVTGTELSWDAVGLKEAPLPHSLATRIAAQGARQSFEVVDRRYELSVAPTTNKHHAARVAVADTKATYDESGRQLIMTRFVVEPAGIDACELVLPENQELVELRLDGRPAILRQMGESKWHVTSGPPHLPFVIDVTARLAGSGNSEAERAAQRPTLEVAGITIPVDLGLWSFAAPARSARLSIAATAGVTAAEQAALRFERLLSIAESGTTAALGLTPPDGDIWLRSWAERLIEARDEATRLSEAAADRHAASQISLPEDNRLAQASIKLDEWLEQVGDAFPTGESNALSAARTELPAVAGASSDARPPTLGHLVTAGELDQLVLDARSAAATAWQSRLAGLAIIAGLCGIGLALMRRPEARDFVYRWPHAIAFVSGLAYWAWLRPSWLGLVIAACSALLAWRSGWPGRAIRMEGSTVLRPTRP
jgi:hypothetical protein